MIFPKTAFFHITAVLLWFCITATAQNSVKQHVVVKGDNIYRLSLRYNVTMEAIFKANPDSRSSIQIGELLVIPEQTDRLNPNPSTATNYNFKTHSVVKGDTKYGLSKRYNCSISDLERINPQIVKMLLAGTVIQIPDSINTNSNTISKDNIHTVIKGETLWLISQKYGLTLSELKTLNPQKTNNIINIGEALTIIAPSKNKSTYTVVKGDTKFELSKRFNTTVETLEQMNPNIVPTLKTGTVITVNTTETISNIITKNTKEEVYQETTDTNVTKTKKNTTFQIVDYIIKPKETLYGLAKKANMSIDEFLTINPALKNGVTKGSLIRMPVASGTYNNEGSLKETPNKRDPKTVDISVLLDNSSIDQKSNYLAGLNKAIDSISSIYPNNNIHINSKKNMDAINDYSETITLFPSDSLGNRLNNDSEINYISVHQNINKSDNKILIQSKPTKADMRDLVLLHLQRQNKTVLCIYDQDHKENLDLIQNYFPKAEFIPTKTNGSFKSSSLKKVLATNLDYAVIVESDKVGVYLSATNILLKEMTNEKSIQLAVLNSENIPSDSNVTSMRFFYFKTIIPSNLSRF